MMLVDKETGKGYVEMEKVHPYVEFCKTINNE